MYFWTKCRHVGTLPFVPAWACPAAGITRAALQRLQYCGPLLVTSWSRGGGGVQQDQELGRAGCQHLPPSQFIPRHSRRKQRHGRPGKPPPNSGECGICSLRETTARKSSLVNRNRAFSHRGSSPSSIRAPENCSA